MPLAVNENLAIDEAEIEISFIRASGPGGQNVNKVATAVQLRFDARFSPSLPNRVKIRLQDLAGNRLTNDGVIVITANRFRSQDRNRADAVSRLLDLIRDAATPPAPRLPTRVSRGQKRKRLDDKAQRASVKQMRGKPKA